MRVCVTSQRSIPSELSTSRGRRGFSRFLDLTKQVVPHPWQKYTRIQSNDRETYRTDELSQGQEVVGGERGGGFSDQITCSESASVEIPYPR